VHLDILDSGDSEPTHSDLRTRLLALIDLAPDGVSRDELRSSLRVRNERLGPLLAALSRDGLLTRDHGAWKRVPVPHP
jgi:hypothetical protein